MYRVEVGSLCTNVVLCVGRAVAFNSFSVLMHSDGAADVGLLIMGRHCLQITANQRFA